MAQHIADLGWDPATLNARVSIDGRVIERAQWQFVMPRAGASIVIRRIVTGGGGGGGGGKSTVTIVAMLAVVALAVAAPYLAPLIANAAFGMGAGVVVATTVGTGIGATLLTAGIGIGGMLAVNALIPPPSSQLDALSGDTGSTSPTLSITGTNNKSIPYGPIPRVYGRHRVFPPLAARPVTEIKGQKQYMRLIFCLGYGPLELSDFKIGETPLEALRTTSSAFSDYILEVDRGPGGRRLTLMPQDVYEEPLSLLLASRQHASTVWFQRRTQVNTVEI